MNNLELYATFMLWKDFYCPISFIVVSGILYLIISIILYFLDKKE